MLRTTHSGGRIHRQHLADDEPIEQHPDGGELLLHTRRPVFLLQLLDLGSDVVWPDDRERKTAILAPSKEPAAYARIGSARVGLRMLAVKNST
jgi:hypothetical protein